MTISWANFSIARVWHGTGLACGPIRLPNSSLTILMLQMIASVTGLVPSSLLPVCPWRDLWPVWCEWFFYNRSRSSSSCRLSWSLSKRKRWTRPGSDFGGPWSWLRASQLAPRRSCYRLDKSAERVARSLWGMLPASSCPVLCACARLSHRRTDFLQPAHRSSWFWAPLAPRSSWRTPGLCYIHSRLYRSTGRTIGRRLVPTPLSALSSRASQGRDCCHTRGHSSSLHHLVSVPRSRLYQMRRLSSPGAIS